SRDRARLPQYVRLVPANSVINAVRRQVRVRVPCDGGGNRLHFHGVPEGVNASIPASAHSTSCSSVAPATPSAPSTWPARMMGRPPGRPISGAPSPMTVAARKYSEPSIDSSPLGRPDLAEASKRAVHTLEGNETAIGVTDCHAYVDSQVMC